MSHTTKVLIADDDPDLRDIVRSVLEASGFEVTEAPDGQQALQAVQATTPDLMILDYMMPGLKGPEVCQRLKQDTLLRHVPIIMLTGKSEIQDKLDGMNAGADDYILKPFDPQELLARVQMVLRRTAQELEANPLTKLPGNNTILRTLESRIATRQPLAVAYVDLDRFKAFNDHYGFQRGDAVIRQTAVILLRAAKAEGNGDDFVGHIGGDDFVLVTTPDRAVAVCQMIVREFDAMARTLHDDKERSQGFFLHRDRQGNTVNVPLISVSIALVTNESQPITHPGEVAARGAELKQYAKQFDRSLYVKERRERS